MCLNVLLAADVNVPESHFDRPVRSVAQRTLYGPSRSCRTGRLNGHNVSQEARQIPETGVLALEQRAVPSAQVRRRLVCTLRKLEERGIRIRSAPHRLVRQDPLA